MAEFKTLEEIFAGEAWKEEVGVAKALLSALIMQFPSVPVQASQLFIAAKLAINESLGGKDVLTLDYQHIFSTLQRAGYIEITGYDPLKFSQKNILTSGKVEFTTKGREFFRKNYAAQEKTKPCGIGWLT